MGPNAPATAAERISHSPGRITARRHRSASNASAFVAWRMYGCRCQRSATQATQQRGSRNSHRSLPPVPFALLLAVLGGGVGIRTRDIRRFDDAAARQAPAATDFVSSLPGRAFVRCATYNNVIRLPPNQHHPTIRSAPTEHAKKEVIACLSVWPSRGPQQIRCRVNGDAHGRNACVKTGTYALWKHAPRPASARASAARRSRAYRHTNTHTRTHACVRACVRSYVCIVYVRVLFATTRVRGTCTGRRTRVRVRAHTRTQIVH